MLTNLLSNTTRVETPYISVKIGGYSFGMYSKGSTVKYPNFMKSLNIRKVNGAVNSYTLQMIYPITSFDDPNLIEKAFSSVSSTRAITFSYGDLSAPNFIFKEEKAIITNVTSSIDIKSSIINYTVSATSSALTLSAGNLNFKKRLAKPSDVIKEILYNKKYGLLDIFYGMKDKDKVLANGLIAGDDRKVTIEAQKQISILDYLTYLVQCMVGQSNTNIQGINNTRYIMNVVDDIAGDLGGPYFRVTRVETSITSGESVDTYEIDVGTFSKDIVLDFNVTDNQLYSILYNYSGNVQQSDYVYRIDNDGNITSQFSPTISNSSKLLRNTEATKNWWTQVTQYPITATITLKGLLRPAILMTYVKINVLFYGRKYIASGTYIITQQNDTIDGTGYRTTLTLTRIKGDDFIGD